MKRDVTETNAGFRCSDCGATLDMSESEQPGIVIATCSSCHAVFDLEGLVCAPAELDALSEDVAAGIRRAFE